jgi:hypothetical protein
MITFFSASVNRILSRKDRLKFSSGYGEILLDEFSAVRIKVVDPRRNLHLNALAKARRARTTQLLVPQRLNGVKACSFACRKETSEKTNEGENATREEHRDARENRSTQKLHGTFFGGKHPDN